MVLSVCLSGELVIEREGVPCEAPAGPERRGDTFEGTAPVGPGRQVKERAEWA